MLLTCVPHVEGMKRVDNCAELIDMFEDEQTDDIIVNYGEEIINVVQINQQLFRDLRWAALSLVLATVMLRVGSGSTFMTLAGIFQIVVRTYHCT